MKKLTTLLILTLSVLNAECIESNNLKLNTQTNLMWSPPAPSTKTWSDAKSYCDDLLLGGYSWFLPSINQLESERVNFGETEVCFTPDNIWSSTLKGNSDAYLMGGARVKYTSKTSLYPVRCVRSNQ